MHLPEGRRSGSLGIALVFVIRLSALSHLVISSHRPRHFQKKCHWPCSPCINQQNCAQSQNRLLGRKADFFLFNFGRFCCFLLKYHTGGHFLSIQWCRRLNHIRKGCIESWMGTNGAVEAMLCPNTTRQIESKESQKTETWVGFLWILRLKWGTAIPPFPTSLPQSESKVTSTQSKQGNNEWGVEAMLFRVVARHKLPV
jgi:hypothetical protein